MIDIYSVRNIKLAMEILIGKNIKVIRVSKQISQKDLAKQVGVTHNYLSMVENDAKKPSLTLMEKLSKALGVPLAALFSELSFS